MARSRNIKPGFFQNETLAELQPLARLLFAGLWTQADREGRLEDRPKRIKAALLPYDNCDVDHLLSELDRSGFINRYQISDARYIQVINFAKHQNPHQKEAESTIPASDAPRSRPGRDCDKPGASPMQAPDSTGTGPADSFNLIPDSLDPSTTLSGTPEDQPLKRDDPAKLIVAYLNERTGNSYRQVDTNLDLIRARLKSGVSIEQIKAVIDAKVSEWLNDPKMHEYLRPATLFAARNFEQYLGQAEANKPNSANEHDARFAN